jgi:hypothetical protein
MTYSGINGHFEMVTVKNKVRLKFVKVLDYLPILSSLNQSGPFGLYKSGWP